MADLLLRDIAAAALADTVDRAVLAKIEMRAVSAAADRLGGVFWPSALQQSRVHQHPLDVPLWTIAQMLALSDVEILTIALTSAVEEDMLLGRAIAFLQAPVGSSRPTLGLLAAAFATVASPHVRNALDDLRHGEALASGLLTANGEGMPIAECAIAVPPHICLALAGFDATPANCEIAAQPTIDVPLPRSIRMDAARHAAALSVERNSGRALVIRSGSEAEARAVAATVAGSIGKRALFIEGEAPPHLAPLLLLRALVPVFHIELAPAERRRIPAIARWRGPVLITTGPDGSFESVSGTALSWRVPLPSREEREELWRAALSAADDQLALELARDHRHGSGRIAQLGKLLRHHTDTGPPRRLTRADLAAAAWAGAGSGLDALAEPLPEAVPDNALVMPATLQRDLELFLNRCRARDGLVSGLGVSAQTRYHPGVRALFIGPSGTGKTLAAGWLATRLGMPLYRVDLASITSKYIGETEKNLAQLLARAEHAEVLLLFDEADSLFGKRTDVKDSNDRFANAQTNYLLQRIETFDSIAILTSNSRGRFDAAFTRRLDAVIEFPQPGPEERRDIWLAHLGDGHTLTELDISRVAARIDLAGGHVRNAVLTAAVLARRDNTPLTWDHVAAGIAAECRKLGLTLPAELGIMQDA